MVDGPPQVVHLAVGLHKDFIDVSAPVRIALHSADPLPLDIGCKHGTKPVPLQPNRFMTNIYSALEQQVFDVPERERIPHIEHHDHADDFRG